MIVVVDGNEGPGNSTLVRALHELRLGVTAPQAR